VAQWKIAPLTVFLASDAATNVSGQIFGVRANEIYFFSQIRMIRSVHRGESWTAETIAEHVMRHLRSVTSRTCPPWS
jgi:hypothetical protein